MFDKINWKRLLLSIAIAELTGIVSGFLSMDGMKKFAELNKPSFTPPGYVFAIVWSLLFLLMGIAAYIIYESDSPEKKSALRFYGLQLAVNFFWSIIFFRFEMPLLAFWWIILLIDLVVITTYMFYKIKPKTIWFMLPYLLWLIFAAFLNYQIYLMNR